MGEAETQWWSARGRDEFCAGTRIVREGGEGGVVASRYPQENKEGSIKMHIKKKKKSCSALVVGGCSGADRTFSDQSFGQVPGRGGEEDTK